MARCGLCRNGILCVKLWEQTHSVGGEPQESQDKGNLSILEDQYVGCLEVREEGCWFESPDGLGGGGWEREMINTLSSLK